MANGNVTVTPPAASSAHSLDEALVRQARQGDRAAMDRLAQEHYNAVYYVGFAWLKSRESAEDLAQEVFLRAFLHLDTLKDAGRFGAWTVRMARNLAADWIRQRQTRSRLLPTIAIEEAPVEIPDERIESASRRLERREEEDALERALSGLSGEMREVLWLYYGQEMTFEEIGERLGLHRTNASRRLDQALGALRIEMESRLRTQIRRAAPRPAALGRTVACLAAVAALDAGARSALAAQAGASLAASASASLASLGASGASSAISAASSAASLPSWVLKAPSLILQGVKAMTLTKKIALAVSAAIVFAGGTRCAFNAFSSSRASQVSRAVLAPPPGQAIRQGVQVPLTQRPGPPPYTIQITPHDAGMSGSRTTQHDPAFFKIVSLSVSAIITSSFGFDKSAAYLISEVDLGKENYDLSLNLLLPNPPQESSQYAWRPLAQREIESAWNLSLRKEKRNVDALILRAPAGKPASLRPGTGNGSYFQHKGSTTRFHNSAIRALCTAMEQITLKPVVDETGITGKFDFEMDAPANEEKAIRAVKKLGFDLTPEKRDIEMIIVASAKP